LFATLLRWIKPRNAESLSQKAAPPVANQPAPPVAPDSDPLEIPGIDTKAALKRTGGNRKRYESLLRKFADPSAGAIEEIRTALAAGDTKTAARGAHSMKGAAANLGAGALAEIAAKTETAITAGEGVPESLHSLANSYQAVAAAINLALPSLQVEVADAGSPADLATVVEPLTRLKILLTNDDGDAADFILDARLRLSKVLTETEISTLSGLVGNFDFEAALVSLSNIAARLSLRLE
jgi:HPt (histidine-containing phosphotransfer) domain-containing protein